jgi:ubiquinone/menaquinone biosynthesis C-methylase UbiE
LPRKAVPVLSAYADAPATTRCFLWLRQTITPYAEIADSFPERGRVLDVGCGHGLLAFTLATRGTSREIIAVDHDTDRIRLARSASARLGTVARVNFQVGDVAETLASFASASLSGVAMIDMLHYFRPDVQEFLIREAYRALNKGGVITAREIDSGSRAKGAANRFYERLATRTGFTQSSSEQLSFNSAAGWTHLLEGVGFTVKSDHCGLPFLADVLFVGRKPL